MAVALASRFWRLGCPKINHDEVATRLALDQVHIEGEAQVAYMEFIDSETGAKWKVQLEQALLAYCKLDTLAMVEMARFYTGHDA
jgi:predicted nucleotide-binding protein (sugar kinase/HSP70/actin superfamily)